MIVSSQFEGAVRCDRCHTHMHPSNGERHMLLHVTEDLLRAAEKRVLEAVAAARLGKVGRNLSVYVIPNDVDQAIIAHAERDRREAQKAYDEARR